MYLRKVLGVNSKLYAVELIIMFNAGAACSYFMTATCREKAQFNCFKPNFPSHSLYYAETCNKFAGPSIFASLPLSNTAPFEEMS